MRKKNIAFIISSMSSGGAERVVSILGNSLCSRFNIFIITMTKGDSFYNLDSKITLLHCIEKIKPSANIFEAIKLNFSLYSSIKSLLKFNAIDLCVGFMTPNNILAILAAKRCKLPVIISERNNPSVESKTLSPIWKYLRKLTYPRADALVLQTKKVRSFYVKFVNSTTLKTIPNPINPDFKPKRVVKKENIILNVGRLTKQKNQELLIRAFSKAMNDDWILKIVGEGELKEELKLLIEKLELQNKVILVGRQSDVEKSYLEAKIFAFSSNYEGFPNALQEAMYFSLPCISTDCPTGPAELILNGKSGFLVPVADEDAMLEKMTLLMGDYELRKSIGLEAAKTMNQYKAENIVEKWFLLFDQLLKS